MCLITLVPGPDVSARRLSPQGCRHLLALTDRGSGSARRVRSRDSIIFTFTREGVPWIDLHWLFQIAISWVYQHGGVVGLNLAKCAITCVAMLILVTARRREWPVWVMVAGLAARAPGSGRADLCPPRNAHVALSVDLPGGHSSRGNGYPWLALLLPIVQVAWVNSQGLFVLGPIVWWPSALFDAALRFGFFAPERRKWWRTILAASLLTGAACLINPYFMTGALYPIELAGTMSNPIFSPNIAELKTIPDFLRSAGFTEPADAIASRDHGLGRSQFSHSHRVADHDQAGGATDAFGGRVRSRRATSRNGSTGKEARSIEVVARTKHGKTQANPGDCRRSGHGLAAQSVPALALTWRSPS